MSRFAGKRAVITGGTHGIGLATARALVEGGARVVVTGRNPDNLESARRALGPGAVVLGSDTSSLAEIDALAERVRGELGRLDLVFVNAGFAALDPFAQVTEASYDRVFAINSRGAFFTVQRLAPLIADGGAVVFTTSIANTGGYPGMTVYAGSKAALRSFAQGFAAELLPRRIRVNAVSPGFIKTPTMGVSDASDAMRTAFEGEGNAITPMGRIGAPEEVAAAVLFLAFDATFTTGVELAVDGGLGQHLTPPPT
jgi:NAD(P)-dependent dehydrogenase (short-subunit alcohol dehydrogenase family)